MASLSQDDIDTLEYIGHDIIRTTASFVVKAMMYSECPNANVAVFQSYFSVALYFVLVVISGRLLL